MDDHVMKPDVLSFHIGSKLPVSEYLRQKLLEIDGTSYRLQKEIQILKGFNLIKCRDCQVCCFRSNKVV
jgi:cereblon